MRIIGYAGGAALNLQVGGEPPEISTGGLPSAYVGVMYSEQLTATGTAPISWEIVEGSLPLGVSLDEATGVISGIPEELGTFDFTIDAGNSYGNDTALFSLTVNEPMTFSGGASRDMRRRGRIMMIYGRG